MPDVGGIAGERLKSFIERVERLEEEKRALAEDIKEVYAEAKGVGFDVKIMRQIVKIRKMDQDELDEQETISRAKRRRSNGYSAGLAALRAKTALARRMRSSPTAR